MKTLAGHDLVLMYRGRLNSCNYHCEYCIFSKTKMSEQEQNDDRCDLNYFIDTLKNDCFHDITIAFIPRGEILVSEYYQKGIKELAALTSVRTIMIQTNLSILPEWLDSCRKEKITLWCTFHPTQTALSEFLYRIAFLHERKIRFCVGAVAVPKHMALLETLWNQLPKDISFWLNPLNDDLLQYTEEERELLKRLDPMFARTARQRHTRGTPCRCGSDVWTIGPDCQLYRCPFDREPAARWGQMESIDQITTVCTHDFCPCFIGYIHWESESFRNLYEFPPVCRITSLR